MGLNIKNERVHDLAREAARVTDKSQTGAIEEALVQLLRQYDADPTHARTSAKVDLVRGVAAAYVADPGTTDPEITRVEDLYDATTGLPR